MEKETATMPTAEAASSLRTMEFSGLQAPEN
jgi:hypothetical protein